MPRNTRGARRRRESPGNVAKAEPVNTLFVWMEAEIKTTDPQLQSLLTGADGKLMLVYGNTIH